jgi:hypothetical protein
MFIQQGDSNISVQSVGYATDLKNQGSIPGGSEIFLFRIVYHTNYAAHPATYSTNWGGGGFSFSLRTKAGEVWS